MDWEWGLRIGTGDWVMGVEIGDWILAIRDWRLRLGIEILDWELGLYIGVWEWDYRLGLGTQMGIRIDIDIQFENYILA